jgi:hypothetical protein
MHTQFRLEKLEGKIPLGRLRHIWKDKIIINLKDTGL